MKLRDVWDRPTQHNEQCLDPSLTRRERIAPQTEVDGKTVSSVRGARGYRNRDRVCVCSLGSLSQLSPSYEVMREKFNFFPRQVGGAVRDKVGTRHKTPRRGERQKYNRREKAGAVPR